MAVAIFSILQVGIVTATLLHSARGLVIKEDSDVDTEYYVAPATYTRKDGKSLPSTIIISRPLGLRTDPHKEKDDEEVDFSQGTFSLLPLKAESVDQDGVNLKPNIQFYKIECTSGQSCTSIIPARTTTPEPPSIPFTRQELKKYLSQFGLLNGFQYGEDFESSGTPSIPDEDDRAFGSNFQSPSNYWPGSSLRPGAIKPSRGQVFKYQGLDIGVDGAPVINFPTQKPRPNFSTSRPMGDFSSLGLNIQRPTKWNKVPTWSNDRFKNPNRGHTHELPRPLSYDDDAIIPPYGVHRPASQIRTTPRPSTTYDGVWNRYSMSTVSQLDKDTGEWVKVSSSTKKLDEGIFNVPGEDLTPSAGTLSPVTHRTKTKLTVLGVSDREPFSAFSDSDRPNHKPHIVRVPSSNPGNPPEMIETDGGYVQNINSVPFAITLPYRPSLSSVSSNNPFGINKVSFPFTIVSAASLTDNSLSEDTTSTSTSSTTTTSTTTTTIRPRITSRTTTTTTTTTTPKPKTTPPPQETAFLDNPYAVMAAVGAGLIPATFAALLPVFIGGGKRRKRRRRFASVSNPSPSLKVPGLSERLLSKLESRVKWALTGSFHNATDGYKR